MKKITLFMLMAVGLLISGNLRAEKTLVAEMTALEQTKSFFWEEGASGQDNVYASAYDALTAALAALPENSTPATVKLFSDVAFEFGTNFYTVKQYQNVTIDLNGNTIAAVTGVTKGSQVIYNNGTLTIDDSSEDKDGIITNFPYNADKSKIPGYASNTILNAGTLILNNGTIENGSFDASGEACYCVENHFNGHNNVNRTFIMNGGKLSQPQSTAVRSYMNGAGENAVSIIIINDGEISAKNYAIATHYNSSGAPVKITINGGTFNASYAWYRSAVYSGQGDFSKQDLVINGGTFNAPMWLGDKHIESATKIGKENVVISSGIFTKQLFLKDWNEDADYTEFITGGIFANFKNVGSPRYTYGGYANKSKYTTADELKAAFNDFTYSNDGEKWTITGDNYGQEDALFSVEKYPGEEALKKALKEEAEIISGENYWSGDGYNIYWAVVFPTGETLPSEYDDFHNNVNNLIAEGYKAVEYDGFDHPETDLIISTLDKKDVEVEKGEKDLNDLVEVKEDGTTEITIIPVTVPDEQTIINITQDTKVNKIKVTTPDGKGEAQIVVKNGVTLDVGNGGIVSENDILTTVLVETGGTLVVGTGGVEQDGLATPIKIQTSEKDGTGTLIFSPNSQTEKTKNYAEVDLYTYSKQVGDGKYTWQHFAVPVTGIADEGKFKPVASEDVYSYIFDWDYKTYSWHQLDAWSKLNTPFAGYDITNESANGGVVYTFKGDLIGNQNTQLTLPNKNYCVMGNSYSAPIDIEALFAQIDKEMNQGATAEQRTIEKTVYKYDAKKGYYVYTNELEIVLGRAGVLDPAFTNIKPMEGFLLNLQSGNTAGVMLNYANAVYNPIVNPKPATAPRVNSNTDMVVAKINVSSAHTTDLVTLVEGDEFSAEIENGKDAFKYLNEGANLYAFDGTNKLAMVATDNLEGTMLAFQAAEDAEYTLTFDRALNTEYVLVDMMNGNEVAMTEGNTYTFFATPNTLDPARFMVKANAQAPTNMERTKATKVAKGIYTITGQYLGESNQWNAMPQGVYMVNGIKVIK